MEHIISKLNIYLIPPILNLMLGLSLAAISIVKGKFKKENILFAIVCIWWCLLSPIFISHHLFRGDVDLILKIERFIHILYVYLPAINVYYYYQITNTKNTKFVAVCFITSFLVCLTVPTNLYIAGLFTYSWGYMAKGGPAFQVFSVYSTATLITIIVLLVKRIRKEQNQIIKMKLIFIISSFVLTGLLTCTNIPSMNGIDSYPYGNMMFITLAFLGYGVLRYKLMDIRSILHITLIWAATSSLIIIPNALAVYFFYPKIAGLSMMKLSGMLFVWFMLNLLYIKKVQPFIDQLFNKRKFDMHTIEAEFNESIASLTSLEDLIFRFTDIIRKTLSLKQAEVVLRNEETLTFMRGDGTSIEIDHDADIWLAKANHLIDKDMVESNPEYEKIRKSLMEIFEAGSCSFIVPLVHNNELMAMLLMPEKLNLRQITADEIKFINNIRSGFSISLANSIMFSNLSQLKDNLEIKVKERTVDLEKAMTALWGEMELAKKIQTVLLPRNPDISGYDISAYMMPADMVGGDYYDIINVGDVDWIVIGDVSGHGIPAGLIMMMVQTSIQVTLSLNTNLNPSELLSVINKTITKNIKNLGEDKYMTITVLAAHKNGKFNFSGLHQDILIYRAATDTVDSIGTNGMWIGMVEDISGMLFNEDLDLKPGDTMLLFTDGITEATKKDSIGLEPEMFGDVKLTTLFEENGKNTPEEIKSMLLKELEQYICNDDVTMVIMKRK